MNIIDFTEWQEERETKEAVFGLEAMAFITATLMATQEIQAAIVGSMELDDHGRKIPRDRDLMKRVYKSFNTHEVLEMMNCLKTNGEQLLSLYEVLRKQMDEDGKLTDTALKEAQKEPCRLSELTSEYRLGQHTFYTHIMNGIIEELRNGTLFKQDGDQEPHGDENGGTWYS